MLQLKSVFTSFQPRRCKVPWIRATRHPCSHCSSGLQLLPNSNSLFRQKESNFACGGCHEFHIKWPHSQLKHWLSNCIPCSLSTLLHPQNIPPRVEEREREREREVYIDHWLFSINIIFAWRWTFFLTFFQMVAVDLTASMAWATASMASFLCSDDAAIITLASPTGTTLWREHVYVVCSVDTRKIDVKLASKVQLNSNVYTCLHTSLS